MVLHQILSNVAGDAAADALFGTLDIPTALIADASQISRGHIAQAVSMLLFHDLLNRVPSGQAYVDELLAVGDKVTFDHGALRTVAWPNQGSLPSGRSAMTRVLGALGFTEAATYPLPRLKMTGYAYCHVDFPEDVAQYFVSELHPEQFSPAFESAVTSVVSSAVDPLTAQDMSLFARLAAGEVLSLPDAVLVVEASLRCFGRHHKEPFFRDYQTLKTESAEMAWISTEGNAFNHATDRVYDVFATAAAQRTAGRAIKDKVEISATGRVRQTALMADEVMRGFINDQGQRFEMAVPGSFYEFISRDKLPDTDRLDLAFDTGNATGIFNVTAAR